MNVVPLTLTSLAFPAALPPAGPFVRLWTAVVLAHVVSVVVFADDPIVRFFLEGKAQAGQSQQEENPREQKAVHSRRHGSLRLRSAYSCRDRSHVPRQHSATIDAVHVLKRFGHIRVYNIHETRLIES